MDNTAPPTELARTLDAVRSWLGRFVIVPDPGDLDTLALWAAHTWALDCTPTTPRLQVDSSMPGSGKTTLLEHLKALCKSPVLAASLGSPALLTRMLKDGPRTILIDEVDRTLNPKLEGTGELLAVINAGYKRGATRPVLTPGGGNGAWSAEELPTYAPVAMAGNAPLLPDDTRSRCIRVLLMPDLLGRAEDTDWEELDAEAVALRDALEATVTNAADAIRERPVLPQGCRGRMSEKWRPLARVAAAAGGHWPETVNASIVRDMAETEREREDGMTQERPAVVLLKHLAQDWPQGERFWRTVDMTEELAHRHPEHWGPGDRFERAITPQRLGRMLTQAFKIHSTRRADGVRGYALADFARSFEMFGLTVSDETDKTGGADKTDRNTGGSDGSGGFVGSDGWAVRRIEGSAGSDGSGGFVGSDGWSGGETVSECVRADCSATRVAPGSYCREHSGGADSVDATREAA